MSKDVKKPNKDNGITETFSYGVIRVYSIPDEEHKGRLKIGDTASNFVNVYVEN